MAQEIRARIHAEVGITASAGIAPNKFVAKVASDWNKPNGQFVVRPADLDVFVAALPVKKIFGVGKVTARKLAALGVETCGDLRAWSLADLTHAFGSFGVSLHRLCRGVDTRRVVPDRVRKSLSVETTFDVDLLRRRSARSRGVPARTAGLAAGIRAALGQCARNRAGAQGVRQDPLFRLQPHDRRVRIGCAVR